MPVRMHSILRVKYLPISFGKTVLFACSGKRNCLRSPSAYLWHETAFSDLNYSPRQTEDRILF